MYRDKIYFLWMRGETSSQTHKSQVALFLSIQNNYDLDEWEHTHTHNDDDDDDDVKMHS